MRILTPKDAGRIQLLERQGTRARVAIRADRAAPEHRQWFSFVARDVAGDACEFTIANAGRCTYADAWEDYRVCASYDGEDWFRVPTEFDGEELRFFHEPTRDAVMYAYFAPYPKVRRQALLAQALTTGRARAERVGQSVNGESMHLLTLGKGERKLWIVGQQHPGESMAAWFMEGLALRLLDAEDEVANDLRERATIYLVLSMNPDGHLLGNHRTNAAGLDLNRAWFEASPSEAPEVFGVRKAMYARGCDFFLDVHGDEHVPYVFVAGAEGNPHYTDRIEALEEYFENAMVDASGDFQTEEGYPKDAPGKGDLRCAGNYVGEAFDCLSLTLEMPFKDNANAPDEERGWNPERCRSLAASTLEALHGTVEALRD